MIYRQATLDEILPVRHEVLRPGMPREAAIFKGDEAPATCHFAALEGHRVIGCLTMHQSELDGRPAWQLRGMAVLDAFQGRGIGRELLAVAHDHLRRAAGPDTLWCNARTTAAGFYEKLGWRIVSPEFMIEGVGPHFKMSRPV